MLNPEDQGVTSLRLRAKLDERTMGGSDIERQYNRLQRSIENLTQDNPDIGRITYGPLFPFAQHFQCVQEGGKVGFVYRFFGDTPIHFSYTLFSKK